MIQFKLLSFVAALRYAFKLIKQKSTQLLILLFATSLGLSIAIASCSSSNSPNSAIAPTPEPQHPKLTVLKMGHQKGIAILNILKSQGNLEQRLKPLGISVEWKEFASTPPLLEAMGVGSIVFGAGGGTGSVFAQASDKPFVRVATESGSARGSAILVREDSPIKSLAALKGKKVAVAKGTSNHYSVVRTLEKVNLKFSDIQPIYISPAEALPAFERGDIDAWAIWDPYTAQAEKTIRTRLLADNSTIFGDRADIESPTFYYAAPDFVRDHPDLLKIILEEVNKSGAWSKTNYKASAKLLSSVYKVDLPTMEVVEQRSADRKVKPVNDDVLTGLQRMADVFSELKIIPKKIDVKDKKYNWIPEQKW